MGDRRRSGGKLKVPARQSQGRPRADCPVCGLRFPVTLAFNLWTHGPVRRPCRGSGMSVR